MDDQRRARRDDDEPPSKEGVRIIGADEAAEAMERGDVTPRRGGDQPRYGDRPASPPAGPRPALRFPLDASADPSRIERPPVQPAPDPVTGPVELPHWTEPPTGEVPAVLIGDDGPLLDDEDDSDVWSSFATSTPRWRDADDDWSDDDYLTSLSDRSDEVRVGALADGDDRPSHDEYYGFDDLEERVEERTGDVRPRLEVDDGDDRWAASDDGSDDDLDLDVEAGDAWPAEEGWEDEEDDRPVVAVSTVRIGDAGAGGDGGADGGDESGGPSGDGGDDGDEELEDEWIEVGYDDDDPLGVGPSSAPDRDMTTAVAVGGGLAVLAIVALLAGPAWMVIVVTAAIGLAAVEYFAKLREVGWECVTLIGIAASVAYPLAIYWRGPAYYPLLVFLTLAAILGWYLVGAGGTDPRVLEGTGATLLGITWIGGLGSSAAAMLGLPDGRALLLTAILATVAYDVGGLFIGKAMGHRPLSSASPNKTLEGLVGGMAGAFVTPIIVVGIMEMGPWTGFGAAFVLGIGAAVAAPLGDLCQSLLKRDLGIKDMGSILPGHGGVLDRVDGMLFVLPTVFWLAVTIGLS
ncbi:MAG: phosphatidate cytidylyltransferase [Actinobacteria bacterium]|nr:phosphatidate cytidylyltransferase [Actinomycetota bacterium]